MNRLFKRRIAQFMNRVLLWQMLLLHLPVLKGTDHPKMKLWWKCPTSLGHPRGCLFLHGNRFGEIQHYITCSPMDPLQWMGAVRMRVQTADTNHLLLSSHIKIHQRICFGLFFACKWCLIFAYFSPDLRQDDFSLEKAILRIILN